jgi:exocyst complex protein 7
MASLKRIDRALTQMTATNIRANQHAIGDFEGLLNEGSTTLQGLFRSSLLEYAKPVEPLHYITKGGRSVLQSSLYYANAR